MRRRAPWWILALLFIVLPVVEIYLIAKVGFAIGWGWTILLLIADGVLGSWLVKHQGSRAWLALQEALAAGRMPAKELADGALILIGGTLLMTPGFLSDIAGLFCVVPFTRPLARRILTRIMAKRLIGVTMPGGGMNGRAYTRPDDPGSGVVRGEVVGED